ncbi:hypothetical protein ACXGQW_01455 [Wenyingzhuangia sp. IMCC45533]
MKKKISLIVLTLVLVSFTWVSKTDFLENLTQQLSTYTKNHPEKIYVHTDKPFYSVEDDIWFSTYLVNGVTHERTDKSRVVHVELLDSKDSIVASKKLYVNHMAASGDFKTFKNWKPGNYLLRAYTNYMRNDKNEIYFQKEIPIHSVQKDSLATTNDKSNIASALKIRDKNDKITEKPEIKFYPEGGYTVINQPCNVAFEVKSKQYGDIKIKGTIKDELGNEVVDFKTTSLNLGHFLYIPEADKSYFACIDINNKEVKYPLPKALSKGAILTITNQRNHLLIKTSSTDERGLHGNYLIAHQRGELLFKKFIESEKKENIIKLPFKGIKDGVTHVTLFNKEGNPIAERLVFIDNPENNLSQQITLSKKNNAVRKKVDVNLSIKNSLGKNISGSVSMAVRDLKAYPYNNKTGNIETWLLLNSDLRGAIRNPNYFFEKPNDPRRKYLLDLVMLTHGWRRFSWAEILNINPAPTEHQPEVGLFISGKTKYLKKPYTEFSAPTRLTFMGKSISQEPIKQSDTLGAFSYGPYIFFDSIPVIIESRKDHFKSKKRKSRDVVILIDQDKNKELNFSKDVIFNKTAQEKKSLQLENFAKVTQYINEEKFKYNQRVLELTEIEIKARRKTALEKRAEEMDQLTDYGSPITGQRLDLLNDFTQAASFTAFEIISQMNGVIAGIDTLYLRRQNVPALVFIDGLEIDASFLNSINGDEISFIDILEAAEATTFPRATGGVIALYSNSGNVGSRNVKRKPGIIDFQAKGFYTARKFYSPDHINEFELINEIDLRTTLYWEPLIRTKATEDTKLSFFTSDLRSDYLIEVEGISDDGIPIHTYTTFVVE